MSDLPFTPPAPAAGLGTAQRRRRRSARVLAILLIVAGALALLDAGITLLWQEPITALIAKFRQEHLSSALRQVERAPPSPVEQRTLASIGDERRRITYLASAFDHRAREGSAVGRIVIPRIGASFVVVKGTNEEDLKSGPGVYPETGLPGQYSTTAIAGHRTTYLAPFRHIDALRPGNRILLRMPYAEFTYTVIGHSVVAPTDVEAAVGYVGYVRLVLSACTPLFSAEKRLLVYARLTRTAPIGAARTLPGGAIAAPFAAGAPSQPAPPPLPAMLKSLNSGGILPAS